MKCPRITIAGLMAAVAVIAFDCFLLMMTDGAGILLVGLALTVGFVCWWRGRGKGKRFWLGFEVAGLAVVVAFIGTIQGSGGLILQWPAYLIEWGLVHLPYATALMDTLIGEIILFEVSFGIPMLLIASVGGLLAMLAPGGVPAIRTPRLRIVTWGLMAAVVALALILGLEVAILRFQAPHVTVRVFNRTPAPLGNPTLQFNFYPGAQQALGITASGATLPAPADIDPGGMTSWVFEHRGDIGFTLSCKTPDGTVKTGSAGVHMDDDYPGSLDFYVEPAGVRAVTVPRPWWLP